MLSAQPYEVKALRDVMVPARDGIKLGTNVFLPARGGSVVTGRVPAIVERTPYNKDGGMIRDYFRGNDYP
jgi:predicted acyl esterase